MSNSERIVHTLIPHCKTLKHIHQIQAYTHKTNLTGNPLITGKLLYTLTQIHPNITDICRYFQSIPNPDTFTCNTLIRALPPHNSITQFAELLGQRCIRPDSFTYVFVLNRVGEIGQLGVGKQVHCKVLINGFDGHLFVGTSLVSMYAEFGCVGDACKVFDEMSDPNVVAWNAVLGAYFRGGDLVGGEEVFRGMPFRNLTSWNVVLNGFVKAGELEVAKRVFGEMKDRDGVSWSTMIGGFVRCGKFEDSFGFFRELRVAGGEVSEVSLSGVLSACAEVGAFELGRVLHGFLERGGFCGIVCVNNALLDTYAKCGDVEMARLVFERMEKRSIVSWSAMIGGLAMHGYGEEALRVFHGMEESGIRPDGVTFISVLYACSHAGLVEHGCMHFSMMKDVYGIEPVIEHYGCMVDLYGRADRLEKAYEIICQMPVPPNDIIWRTLLGACSFHGNIELAKQVKKKLLELDPKNSGDLVLLSNTYAISGKWKDVVNVRRSMAEQSIKKSPGWSSIEVDKMIYNFVAGEKQSKIVDEANEKLREIMLRLKIEEGYTPVVGTVLHDIEEEDKEDSVTRHSEKLAIAFGLARLRGRKSLRVFKNLRICKDCHIVMKLISKVYGIEIVLRDRSRFHSFISGSCSCKDYW